MHQRAIKYAAGGSFNFLNCQAVVKVRNSADGTGAEILMHDGSMVVISNCDYHQVANFVFDQFLLVDQPPMRGVGTSNDNG